MAESLKDKTAKGFFWGLMSNGLMQVLNAVFGIVLARRLSQDDYGLIGMMTIFTCIASSLQDSGFISALTNRREPSHRDYNAVFWFNVGVSGCLYVLFFACAPLLAVFYDEPLLTSLFRYYSLGFVAAAFSIVPRAMLFKQMRQRELAVVSVVSLAVSGSVGVGMAWCGMAYWGLATQSICYTALVSVLSWVLSGWRPSRVVSLEPVREMFGFSSRMLVTSIFSQVNNNVFSVVLGRFYSKSEVGLYNQANKWNTMGASTINGMVQGVAQPAFVAVGDDVVRLRRVFSKMLRFTCFVCFPLMFGLAMVAPEFIVILITDKWLPSAELLRVLCVGGAFLPVSTLYYNVVISRGRSDVFMWNTIAQGVAILAAILLIEFMGGGIVMMVYAYVAIVIVWVGVWNWFVWREIGFGLVQSLRDIVPFVVISGAAVLGAYFATLGVGNVYVLFVCRVLLAAVLYLGLMWVCGAKILRECLAFVKLKF